MEIEISVYNGDNNFRIPLTETQKEAVFKTLGLRIGYSEYMCYPDEYLEKQLEESE